MRAFSLVMAPETAWQKLQTCSSLQGNKSRCEEACHQQACCKMWHINVDSCLHDPLLP